MSILNIDSRVTLPGSFVNPVTPGTFMRFPKEIVTTLQQSKGTGKLSFFFRDGLLESEAALGALKKLSEFISEDEYSTVRLMMEKAP